MEEAIDSLKNLVVPLVGVGIIVVIGLLIFSESKTVTIRQASSTNVTNEEVALSALSQTTALAYSTHAIELSCTEIRNASVTGTVLSANYTCDTSGINVTQNMTIQGTVYVDYTYKNTTSAYKGISSTQNATQDIPGWLAIIVIVIIGGVLISLISYFRKT